MASVLARLGSSTLNDERDDSKALTALADATTAPTTRPLTCAPRAPPTKMTERITKRNPRCGRAASARGVAITTCLLIAPFLLLLAACSTTPSLPPTPEPQANLEADRPPVEPRPVLLLDPARLLWETRLVAQYGDCANRHHKSVAARSGQN